LLRVAERTAKFCRFSAAVGRRCQELLRWERSAAWLHEAEELHPEVRPLKLERWDQMRALTQQVCFRRTTSAGANHQQVNQRDGHVCATTGENIGLVVTEVIPDCVQARFRYYASVFFDGAFDRALAEENLSTTCNALFLTRNWFQFFDDGKVVLQEQFEQVHVECVPLRDDPRISRRGNPAGHLCQPGGGLILRNGPGAHLFPPIDRDLLSVHRAVILAFHATGFAGRLLREMQLVDEIPRSQLRIDRMTHAFFYNIVSHKLSLV